MGHVVTHVPSVVLKLKHVWHCEEDGPVHDKPVEGWTADADTAHSLLHARQVPEAPRYVPRGQLSSHAPLRETLAQRTQSEERGPVQPCPAAHRLLQATHSR